MKNFLIFALRAAEYCARIIHSQMNARIFFVAAVFVVALPVGSAHAQSGGSSGFTLKVDIFSV